MDITIDPKFNFLHWRNFSAFGALLQMWIKTQPDFSHSCAAYLTLYHVDES